MPPAPAAGVAPCARGGCGAPVARSGGAPVARSGGAPVARSGGAPVARSGGAPVARSGGAPVARRGGGPVARSGGAPVARSGGAPVARSGGAPDYRASMGTCRQIACRALPVAAVNDHTAWKLNFPADIDHRGRVYLNYEPARVRSPIQERAVAFPKQKPVQTVSAIRRLFPVRIFYWSRFRPYKPSVRGHVSVARPEDEHGFCRLVLLMHFITY